MSISERQKSLIDGAGQPSSSISKSSDASRKPTPSISVSLKPMAEIWNSHLPILLGRGTVPTYPIGLKSLDDLIWGLHKKEMMCLGARTSHGKSAMAMQMALNLADIGTRVVYLSLEMSSEQLLERAFAYLCGVDGRLIRVGQAKSQIEHNNSMFINMLSSTKMLIDDKYGYDFDKVVEIANILKPDFLFLDYIQMISTRGYKSKLEAIEEYVRKFKELANTLGFGIILVSQINREGADNMGMHHLKGAGVLEEHSDTVMLLDWDKGVVDEVTGVRSGEEYKVTVAKQRHGPTGEVRLDFDPGHFRFKDSNIQRTARVLPSVPGKVYRTASSNGRYPDK